MSLPEAIAQASRGCEVPAALLEAAFGAIADGEATEVQIAALLVALRTKGETPSEISAAARALRARAIAAPLVDERTVDTCGTGGDGAGTFNVSTAAAFVVAGAGVPVAKHGNRAASSRTGSFDVLEALGVCIDLPIEACARILSEIGIAPFFARVAHPAMKHVAPVRKQLGIRTLMNCLGPLLNPMGAKRQLVGVYEVGLVEPLARALANLGAIRAMVVHGSDGLDELTTTGLSTAATIEAGTLRLLEVDPEALGLPLASAEALAGGDAALNADILREILDGKSGPRRDIVLLNAAAGLWAAGEVEELAAGIDVARRSIDSGAAGNKLEQLIAATRAAAQETKGGGGAR